jgi:hypothetical protein
MDHENPDGGGVAWLESGQLRFERGLTSEQIFYMQEAGTLTYPYLLHFRWATHGGKIPGLTHPFPTGPRAFDGELSGVAEQVLIHNGVWHDYNSWLPMVEGVDEIKLVDTSDTAVAAYFYSWFPDIADEIPWAVATASIKEGAIAIVKHGGWSSFAGNEYSNLHWLPWDVEAGNNRRWARGAGGGWAWAPPTPTPTASDFDWNDWQEWAGVKESAPVSADPKEDSWRDYVRWRYGDDVAAAVHEAGAENEDDAITMAKLAALEELDCLQGQNPDADSEYDDEDLMSDDPATVNAWLGRKTAASYLKTHESRSTDTEYTHFAKCEMCDVYTRAKDGICGYCVAVLAKQNIHKEAV